MIKRQGLTALVVVVFGALLKTGSLPTHTRGQGGTAQSTRASSTQSEAAQTMTEGPWEASCHYWEPGRSQAAATPSRRNQAAAPGHGLGVPNAECGPKNWGLPAGTGSQQSFITALVATVPDPIHSGMPLEFDRTIDVLTQAAAEYGYVASYFWLPWRTPPSDSTELQRAAPAGETDADFQREGQPGLLVLRQKYARPEGATPQAESTPWEQQVVYLFLVGQSPALGVNGNQLRNAIQYEQYLKATYGARLSFKPRDVAEVIGPNSSGAAASLRSALDSMPFPGLHVSVAGITSTTIAKDLLNGRQGGSSPVVQYLSFGDNSEFDQDKLTTLFERSLGERGNRIAFLGESGTVFGSNSLNRSWVHAAPSATAYKPGQSHSEPALPPTQDPGGGTRVPIQFPRNISLLRNAQKEGVTPVDAATADASPYLHLSLKDSSVEDSIQPFSPQTTEYSQEAQWMAIVRELQRRDIGVVALSASNILDELFLIKSLHRDVPDATVVVYDGGDLLFTRVGDNGDYIGDVTFTAYPLVSLSPVSGKSTQLHDFADSLTEGLFNAASYTFWKGDDLSQLHLAEYTNPLAAQPLLQPPLWATAVGRDGYYPLGIANECASDNPNILPTVSTSGRLVVCGASHPGKADWVPQVRGAHSGMPGLSWYLLCAVITILCLGHALILGSADFWSPMTRDLAIADSDQPRRRTVYIHIAVAVLFAMSFIASFPVIPVWHLLKPGFFTCTVALVTALSGIIAVLATLRQTSPFLWRSGTSPVTEDAEGIRARKKAISQNGSEIVFYRVFNLIALLTAILVPLFWTDLCLINTTAEQDTFVGLFFGYRCLYPASGVCPLLPVLLILLTWYLWALLQTKRLRFSDNSRPVLPSALQFSSLRRFYVSDEALQSCSRATDSCLYENANCLLITRQLIRRSFTGCPSGPPRWLNPVLICLYCTLFSLFVLCFRVQGLDRFFRPHHFYPAPFELLVSSLFFPLLVVAIAGAVRMVVLWSSLNRGLLAALERSPFRFAFSRLTDVGWMAMLRQGGVYEYWRDMVRSIESIQQLASIDEIKAKLYDPSPDTLSPAEQTHARLSRHILSLLALIGGQNPQPGTDHLAKPQASLDRTLQALDCFCKGTKDIGPVSVDCVEETRNNYLTGNDLPVGEKRRSLNLMCAIECEFANYATLLLSCSLIPYWLTQSRSLVESHGTSDSLPADPDYIQLAAEFVAIRYVSLIRAILINLRFLMTFVSTAFVLALVAWNSYPFQPRQWVDWTFTLMLFGIGSGVVWVFAQMHRNPILSRITGTNVNELGSDFFVRLATFGAVPFLTWVASQFPSISNWISRLLQSGLASAK